ncbi:3'-5' exonuclease domain-containing protein 2 [Marinilabiliaceae bacterium ANBcel2]|nr:3'-5' exonuclease domain-containing protein 2 [Marinilabiliaceae bacterium ANBcel2]
MVTSISKEAIADLPRFEFKGKVTVIEDANLVDGLVEKLSGYSVLGFDTETKPCFKKGGGNKISLLQLATNDEVFLFRINKTGLLPSLINLLEDESVLKVGVGIRDDLRGLNEMVRFWPMCFIELQDVAKKLGIKVYSLKALAGLLLDVRVSKRQRLSNWEADVLTSGQIDYAAADALIALKIYEELKREFSNVDINSLQYKS